MILTKLTIYLWHQYQQLFMVLFQYCTSQTGQISKFLLETDGGVFEIIQKFPKYLLSGKFPKCVGIWKISQMPGYLENIPPQITIGISQMPGYLGNFPHSSVSVKFPKCLGIQEISQMPGYLQKQKSYMQKRIKFCTNFADISNRKPAQTYSRVKGTVKEKWKGV